MGARGLRSVIEDIMLDVMYELPSMEDVARCIIDESVVRDHKPPQLKCASAGYCRQVTRMISRTYKTRPHQC
jgi:ATP-dependent protease Clp ATPase subunit